MADNLCVNQGNQRHRYRSLPAQCRNQVDLTRAAEGLLQQVGYSRRIGVAGLSEEARGIE
jgi:hypothetical protein